MPHDYRTRAPLENLKRRAELLAIARRFFDSRGFVEVQTPVLSRDTIIDRHLDPITLSMQLPATLSVDEDISSHRKDTWYLQTSPEQAMKRLLASGMGNIYQIGPVFRAGELGQRHNPEFTMAEWYDVGADLEGGLRLLDELLQALLGTSTAQRVTFADAFRDATKLDLFSSSVQRLANWCVEQDLVDSEEWSDDWDDWVNLIFSERVQELLGWNRPVLITHFPSSQAALAKVDERDPRVAERYELFYRGIELANGYHELTDGDLLEQRAIEANKQRISDGKSPLPVANRLIDAMRVGLPSSCGCALGFDRVVMLACNAKSIDEVVAFIANDA